VTGHHDYIYVIIDGIIRQAVRHFALYNCMAEIGICCFQLNAHLFKVSLSCGSAMVLYLQAVLLAKSEVARGWDTRRQTDRIDHSTRTTCLAEKQFAMDSTWGNTHSASWAPSNGTMSLEYMMPPFVSDCRRQRSEDRYQRTED
jgi:hypothetical protein